MEYVYFLLLVGCIIKLSCGQDCGLVEKGLEPILAPCRRSVSDCVIAQDLPGLSQLFCRPEAEMQFDNFNTCTNRNFSDQIFGAICGSSECKGTCVGGEKRCFETINNATEVFEECMCDSQSSSRSCPSLTCKNALQELVSDVGCCANSVLYVFYLDSCMESESTIFTQKGFSLLLEACGVPFPSSCPHLFSDSTNPSRSSNMQMRASSVLLWLISIFFCEFL